MDIISVVQLLSSGQTSENVTLVIFLYLLLQFLPNSALKEQYLSGKDRLKSVVYLNLSHSIGPEKG